MIVWDNVPDVLLQGLAALALPLSGHILVQWTGKNEWHFDQSSDGWKLSAGRPSHLFRLAGWLKQAGFVERTEKCRFQSLGLSIDTSQGNAAPTVDKLQALMPMLAMMGYDCLMLYSEDAYPTVSTAYFGHMRGRYTRDELQALDQKAQCFGLELIPCIQTLAHLSSPLRWAAFSGIAEDEATLLVGEEKTYQFIEELIAACADTFHSKRIHIGQDEAWNLGLGAYLRKNGYHAKTQIMREHLARVNEIVRRYGLEPMMWSDMLFRLTPENGGKREEYAIPQGGVFGPEEIECVPDKMRLNYWEYLRAPDEIEKRLRLHTQLCTQLSVTGHIRINRSIGANYSMSLRALDDLIKALDKTPVADELFASVWGDDAPESILDEALLGMQMYAERQFDACGDMDEIKNRFQACTGGKAEDFYALDGFDDIPCIHGEAGNQRADNPSKWLLWQAPMLGLFDDNIKGLPLSEHYHQLAKRLKHACSGPYAPMFRYLGQGAETIGQKALLGVMITDAYRAKDRAALLDIAENLIPKLADNVREMRLLHREIFFKTYQPEGWEVFDVRYGGLLAQLDTTIERLRGYAEGLYPVLDELERPRLPYNGQKGLFMESRYAAIVTSGKL